MAAFLLAFAASAQPVARVHPAEQVTVRDGRVHLGDLAGISGTHMARALERRVVAVLPHRQRSHRLTNAAIAALIRRAVPGLAISGGPPSLTIHRDPQSPRPDYPAVGCVATVRPVASGAMLRASDLTASACGEREAGASGLQFDRVSGAVRTTSDLPAGARLDRVVLPAGPDIERGRPLTIVSVAGPVRIERPAIALQAGRQGRRIFVRDADGQVFIAPVAIAGADRP